MRLQELALTRVRYGYRRLHVLLRREGWQANHKLVYRLYREEGLSIRTRSPKRRRACRYRSGRPAIGTINDCWAMDFMPDKLFDDRSFRILTIVDCHTREALATVARTNFRAYQVIDELDRLARLRGKPRSIQVDNGPEFADRMLDQWAYMNKVELDFSRPGKPSDNAFKTYLGRVYRDVGRKIADDPDLQQRFARLLGLVERLLTQTKDSKRKLYSLHAPEVACFNRGKASSRYEFGAKVGIAATNRGGFILAARTFEATPYDGHTLKATIVQSVRASGIDPKRIYVDRGYRGHDYEGDARVIIAGQKRGVTPTMRREQKRRNGLPLNLAVHAANIQDRDGLALACRWIKRRFPWLLCLFADAGYQGPIAAGHAAGAGLRLESVKRPPHAEGFEVIPRRWVIERTFGWLSRNRRLARDFERLIETSTAMVVVAIIQLLVRRLANS